VQAFVLDIKNPVSTDCVVQASLHSGNCVVVTPNS